MGEGWSRSLFDWLCEECFSNSRIDRLRSHTNPHRAQEVIPHEFHHHQGVQQRIQRILFMVLLSFCSSRV